MEIALYGLFCLLYTGTFQRGISLRVVMTQGKGEMAPQLSVVEGVYGLYAPLISIELAFVASHRAKKT